MPLVSYEDETGYMDEENSEEVVSKDGYKHIITAKGSNKKKRPHRAKFVK